MNRELSCLKTMFNQAINWKYVSENPVKGVKLFQERKLAMKILSKEEINGLIEESADHLKPILILALNTGMRRGEIFNLRWTDIDFNDCYIYIKDTKSNRSRNVPINDLVVDALMGIKHESEYVFYNPETKDRIKDVKTAFKAACRRADITDLRFHDLRHTAATYMVMGGVDLVTVAEILGHSDLKMVMRYAHPTPENKRKAVETLANSYGQGLLDNSDEDIKVITAKDTEKIEFQIHSN